MQYVLCFKMYVYIYYDLLGAKAPTTLLIGYYHGLLLRDIDGDMLADEMCSGGLLTSHEQNVISTGHSVYQRNWLLLEYARHMDAQAFMTFCDLLQESWPEIGQQLITGVELVYFILFS